MKLHKQSFLIYQINTYRPPTPCLVSYTNHVPSYSSPAIVYKTCTKLPSFLISHINNISKYPSHDISHKAPTYLYIPLPDIWPKTRSELPPPWYLTISPTDIHLFWYLTKITYWVTTFLISHNITYWHTSLLKSYITEIIHSELPSDI